MKKSYTSRIIKPPRLIKVENLATFLNFYDVDNSNDLVESLKKLLDSTSLYSFLEVAILVTTQSEVILGLFAIEKVVKSSLFNREALLQTGYPISYDEFLTTLKTVKDQFSLTDFLTNYLGLKDFTITDLYSNPYSLLDWIVDQDALYTSIFSCLKNLDLFNFFIELIKVKSLINISEHIRCTNILEINIKSDLYKNVMGSFPLEY